MTVMSVRNTIGESKLECGKYCYEIYVPFSDNNIVYYTDSLNWKVGDTIKFIKKWTIK